MLGGSAEADREIGPMGTCRSPRRPRHVHAIGMVPAPPTPHALPDPRGWTSTRSGWRAGAGQRNQGEATSRRREPPIQMKIGLPRHPHPPAFPHKDTYRALWVVVSVNPLGHARCATRGEVRGQMGKKAYRRAKTLPALVCAPGENPMDVTGQRPYKCGARLSNVLVCQPHIAALATPPSSVRAERRQGYTRDTAELAEAGESQQLIIDPYGRCKTVRDWTSAHSLRR